MANIVAVTKGTYGDVIPFIALGTALKQRGHRVTLVSHCHYKALAEGAGLEFDCWDTSQEYYTFVNDTHLLEDFRGIERFSHRHIFPTVKAEMMVIEKHCASGDTILISKHMGALAASFVAERRRVPIISVFVAAAQMMGYSVLIEIYRSVLSRAINKVRQNVDLPAIEDWNEWAMSPTCFAGCWPPSFATVPDVFYEKFVPTGFLKNDDAERGELPSDLLEGLKSPSILITGGTARSRLAPRFYRIAAEACAEVGTHGILVCPHESVVPGDLPASILRFKYLPFATLMPRVRAVIHHGGTSVLVRAISAGVPQLMLPFGADRPDTARRVERLGIGRCIIASRWSASSIATVLSELMSSVDVRNACLNAQGLLLECKRYLDIACVRFESLAVQH